MSQNSEWQPVDSSYDNKWLTFKMKVPNGWLFKTVDEFYVTDKEGKVSMTDWKVTVTFVPE